MKRLMNGLIGAGLIACCISTANANEDDQRSTDEQTTETNAVDSESTLLTAEKGDRDEKQANKHNGRGSHRTGPGGPPAMRRGKSGPPFGNLSQEQVEKIRERMQMRRERGHDGGPPWAQRNQGDWNQSNRARRGGDRRQAGRQRSSRDAHRGQRGPSARMAQRPGGNKGRGSARRGGPARSERSARSARSERSERSMNRGRRGPERAPSRPVSASPNRGRAAVQELREEMKELKEAVRKLSEQLEQQSA
ncbi:MAG: hypothetical protein P8N76_04500 [Pirellulaceae bacterium]|nr:hypothetical protein [Pirellulaceae bacterium]